MREIQEFDEFTHNEYDVTTDLGSAYFDDTENVVRIQGTAQNDGEKSDVEVTLIPEDTPEFNINISASEGELTSRDLFLTAELDAVTSVESGEELWRIQNVNIHRVN